EPSLDMRGSEPPLRNKTIGRRSAMERTARVAVNIVFVFLDDNAQPGEVEMSVQGLQWIVGPLDQIYPRLHHLRALREFQLKADSGGSRVWRYGEHVGPVRGAAVLQCRHRVHEALQDVSLVERSQQKTASLDGNNEEGRRDYVFSVDELPHRFLER